MYKKVGWYRWWWSLASLMWWQRKDWHMICVTWCYPWEDISTPCTRNQQQTKFRILSGFNFVNQCILLGLLIEADLLQRHLPHQMATPERETAQGSQEPGAHNVQMQAVLETVFPGQFVSSLSSTHCSYILGCGRNVGEPGGWSGFQGLPEFKGLPCRSESFTCVLRSSLRGGRLCPRGNCPTELFMILVDSER